jgi:Tol biopolymer transport system component
MRRALIVTAAVVAATATACGATADSRPSHPDTGGKIAFTSNRTGGQDEIVVANADGTGRIDLNAQGRSPEFSPDGRRIAFSSTRDGNSEIYVMNADGSNQTRLTFNTLYDSRPQWAADGRKLVFMRITADGNWEIFRLNADGSDQVDLTNSPAFEWGQSTQGDRTVFTREEGGVGHIFEMNLEGKGVRRITNTSSYDSYPNQSPRGDLVLFSRDTADGSGDDLWVTREAGSGERQLTHQSLTGYISEATWSPDGSQILYSQCAPGGANPCALHLMNADGSDDQDISTPAAPFAETFDNGVTDGGLWYTIADSGGSVGVVDGRVQEFISHDADPTLHNFNQVDEQVGFQCRLVGDFDYQVDYALLNWPAHNGFFAMLNAIFGGGAVARVSTPWDPPYDESYNAWTDSPTFTFDGINTTDTSGQMRLVRQAGVMYAYERSGPAVGWTLIHTGPASGSTIASMELIAPLNSFAHQDGLVAFDNFRLNSGPVSCPTWWSDNFADWTPLRGDR